MMVTKTNRLSHCTHLLVKKNIVSICSAPNKLYACLDTPQTQKLYTFILKEKISGFCALRTRSGKGRGFKGKRIVRFLEHIKFTS
jgi:hypothetical protein